MVKSMEASHRRAARAAIREAMGQGRWLGVSDACIDVAGRASVAWAVFDPSGALAASGAARVELSEERSTSDAEGQGMLMAALALRGLGAPSALMLCDCRSAIERMSGARGPGALGRADFEALSRGRYEIRWAPRSMMGPANDACRAELGLRPEGELARGWAPWMAAARGAGPVGGVEPEAGAPRGVRF